MARLIPKVELENISLKPERDVAKALVDKLPNDCVIYHSYPWLRTDRNDRDGSKRLREGETDFVIIVPSHGLLVLEVKGGVIEYDPADHWWYRRLGQERRKGITDPFEQARRNTHYIIDRCVEQAYNAAGNVPFTFGYAVVFPDCEYDGPAPPGAEPAIILSAKDLPYLDRRIKEVLRQWCPVKDPVPLKKEDQSVIQRVVSPPFNLLPVLFRQLEEEEERLFRLTEEQMRLLDFLAQRKRAAIDGVAGSGKTMLARAQAQRFADAGLKTLFVCYNTALAQWLRSSIPEQYQDRIVVRHFHGLCKEWCNRAKIRFSPPEKYQDDFWRQEAPNLLLEASELVPDRFDAVVVDEGQDFMPDWWLPLENLNAQGEVGAMYVFYDPAQNLFVEGGSALPDLGQPFKLPTNCRNTREIARTCGGIINLEIPTHPNAPEGVAVQFIHAADHLAQQEEAGKVLHEWINKGNLKTSQVAILSPVRWENTSMPKKGHIKNVPLTMDLDEWREDHGVLFSTIRAFKGLEADTIIIIDVPEPDTTPSLSKNDFYVACSRAKHRLVVLAKTEFFKELN